jgi:hypothetical protein
MHDPMTVAFEIKWPFPAKKTWGNGAIYRDYKTLVTIWHVDPESDGTDDSCGWPSPRLTDRERKIIDDLVEWEKLHPYYSSPYMPLTLVDPKYD